MAEQAKKFNQSNRKLFLWITVPFLIFLIIVTRSAWTGMPVIGAIWKHLGIFCIVMCIVGRCWAILYIGDKKNNRVVDQGPYRYTRNPLYFFSALGMLGFGLMFESFFMGAILFTFTYLSFLYVARKEAADLTRMFGDAYRDYASKVPEFFPDLSPKIQNNYADDQVTFSPKALKKTFMDACLFLPMIPLAEIIVSAHNNGSLNALLSLY